ncbi:MAG: hypothetical protein LBL19_03250 [Spirochaetaceae bacterium]|jgi:hypothetical protein|nr:hypothetical protein [Spirochaetaceae bacterium]
MPLKTASLVSLFVSAALGFAVFYIDYRSLPPILGKGYAVVSLDASRDDRYIGELLARGNWGNYISESTQWVFWDDFGELARIPLDSYADRVEPFDPRNDGYAGRLESFFVHDGKRFFFIPLPPDYLGNSGERLTADLSRCFGDIPFRVELPGASRPLGIYAVLFAGAAVGMVLLSRAAWTGISLLPLLAALCYRGPGGFALASVLTALFALVREPLGDFFISRRYWDRYAAIAKKSGKGPSFWGALSFFLAAYGGICYLGRIPVSLALAGIVSGALILGLSLLAESKRGIKMGHVRFVPVRISVYAGRGGAYSRVMAPFALASLGALLLPSLLAGPASAVVHGALSQAEPPGEVIRPGEYEAHAAFQASFSLRPLRTGVDAPDPGPYLRYHRGNDGLIGDYAAMEDAGVGEIPPFPLEDLMNFLAHRNYAPAPAAAPEDRLPVFGALLLCIPIFLQIGQRHGKKKGLLVYNDKRIAA